MYNVYVRYIQLQDPYARTHTHTHTIPYTHTHTHYYIYLVHLELAHNYRNLNNFRQECMGLVPFYIIH